MARPEWLGILEQQLKDNPKARTYALATVSEGRPKVRHVVHRAVTPSGLLLTTTDRRMQKPKQLAVDHGVELAWWIEGSAVQFRISGQAHVVSQDRASALQAIAALGLADGAEEASPEWWERQRAEIWAHGMSSHLRGSFGRPPPGKPLSEIKDRPEDWIETLPASSDDADESKDIERALANFTLVAIQPEAAEYLELAPTPNVRAQWTRQPDGAWNKTHVAP